jgi:hypothetical protein
MPIREFINLAFIILVGICITHPMDAALTIRKVELSILREASDTRSWGTPVWLPNERITSVAHHGSANHSHGVVSTDQ